MNDDLIKILVEDLTAHIATLNTTVGFDDEDTYKIAGVKGSLEIMLGRLKSELPLETERLIDSELTNIIPTKLDEGVYEYVDSGVIENIDADDSEEDALYGEGID